MGIKKAHKKIKKRKELFEEALLSMDGRDHLTKATAEGTIMGLEVAIKIIEKECPKVLELPNLVRVDKSWYDEFCDACKQFMEAIK